MTLITLQCLRRFHKTWFVQVFSSKLKITHQLYVEHFHNYPKQARQENTRPVRFVRSTVRVAGSRLMGFSWFSWIFCECLVPRTGRRCTRGAPH
ncbi:uncharacterized protein LOC120897850 [Anopheles arabiensis]|uniref:uncharacterized protein LOC120897850 n=1 Tax=Anopheles arabiensis TaxID=7173 RepID=UPI001AAD3B0E|nr:uncharacterized protein LOC120897850 [Anopheles arabiensis]